MVPRDKVKELVDVHARLPEDPAAAVVWFRKEDEPMVWLFEVIPTLDSGDSAEEPIFFNPGAHFRFPLALIAGSLRTLKATLMSDPKLAKDLASGEVMLDSSGDAKMLVEFASSLA
jgi:hypothetical protein